MLRILHVKINFKTARRNSCPQKNDRFTVSDTAHGNGALTYPIGLITSDEAIVAGAVYEQGNSNIYLSFSGQGFHGMSPSYFEDRYAYTFSLVGICWLKEVSGMASHVGVRPVINLKPGSINAGDKTASNPFRIE